MSYTDLTNKKMSYTDPTNKTMSYTDLTNKTMSYTDPTNKKMTYTEPTNKKMIYTDLTNKTMSYMDLIRKLEKRFGFRELPEMAQVQFNNARQTPEELLEDCADRVLSLATRAFRDLPETHMY
jgi:hypothetical protein